MKHSLRLTVGPVTFRIGSEWSAPVDTLRHLYAGYNDADAVADFTVRLEAERPWRRWIRPSIAIRGDFMLPEAAPLSIAHGLLAAEMGMNLQMALGQKRYLLLHAASVERDGRALLLTGLSGAGKSTLSAILGERGWRFMGDEFALLGLDDGLLHPFPRAVSLKNSAIDAMRAMLPEERFGPQLYGTPKGTIRHLRPSVEAVARMREPARPALILFPRFGHDWPAEVRSVGEAELFMRLTQASTNYVALGEPAFAALTALVKLPARAVDYGSTDEAVAMVEQLWREAA
ncbi:HprK-related kinase A [Allosphingosinicella indica]|uniref:Hpr(Ser) kinase/phosphatase n=1 Tax=Allosphingosinicella indica TaxID=941907 RepID=A0A1X7H0X3_9SPHN|nr:HprK-related kinase A [Allosphingosinicella indica]SMF77655.1 Hpr(Ser) kinase/phosphatase [Allosphingosinicella indica]